MRRNVERRSQIFKQCGDRRLKTLAKNLFTLVDQVVIAPGQNVQSPLSMTRFDTRCIVDQHVSIEGSAQRELPEQPRCRCMVRIYRFLTTKPPPNRTITTLGPWY